MSSAPGVTFTRGEGWPVSESNHQSPTKGDRLHERPGTRFAYAPDGVALAYELTGDGPTDIVFVSGLTLPMNLLWEEPGFVSFAKGLCDFSRTVWCDTRGMGLSEGDFWDGLVDDIADADLTAVVDAVGRERVVLVGTSGAGPTVIRWAMGHPERTSALVLVNTHGHYVQEDDYPWGIPADSLMRFTAWSRDTWGSGAGLEILAPSKIDDAGFRAWWARCQRLGVGADQAVLMLRGTALQDVRAMLPELTVSTAVLHREGNRVIRIGAGRYLAQHIPGAHYVELPGDDHWFFAGDTDTLVGRIEEFLSRGYRRCT